MYNGTAQGLQLTVDMEGETGKASKGLSRMAGHGCSVGNQ